MLSSPSAVFVALIAAFVLGALSSGAVVLRVLSKRAVRDDLEQQAFRRELKGVFWEIRDIFDHFPNYADMPEALSVFLLNVSTVLTYNATQFLDPHSPLREGSSGSASKSPPTWLRGDQVLLIERGVQQLCDPVMTELWAVRTPRALAAMLRHGLFLGLGYSKAVAFTSSTQAAATDPSSLEGRATVPNAGAIALESLREAYGKYWKERSASQARRC